MPRATAAGAAEPVTYRRVEIVSWAHGTGAAVLEISVDELLD